MGLYINNTGLLKQFCKNAEVERREWLQELLHHLERMAQLLNSRAHGAYNELHDAYIK